MSTSTPAGPAGDRNLLFGALAVQTNQLSELHDYREDRFERHLMLMRNRAERR